MYKNGWDFALIQARVSQQLTRRSSENLVFKTFDLLHILMNNVQHTYGKCFTSSAWFTFKNISTTCPLQF